MSKARKNKWTNLAETNSCKLTLNIWRVFAVRANFLQLDLFALWI
jgi:hypothetical protein